MLRMTFLFGTEIFAKYFPLFSIRNFFSVINFADNDNIKPSKADTAVGRNNPVVYGCEFGGGRQLKPISYKSTDSRTSIKSATLPEMSSGLAMQIMQGKGCQSVTVF